MSLTAAQQHRLIEIRKEIERRKRNNKIDQYYPDEGPLRRERYSKHLECFAAGRTAAFRCVMGSNRSGKSEGIGAYETALHATGDYPKWWIGHRFDRPIRALCVASDTDQLRKSVQRKLFGKDWGTGMIRADLLPREEARLWGGTAGVFLFAKIKHKTGGYSELSFGTYEQGREAFEAFELDWAWEDEEPPIDIHNEIMVRTMKSEQLDIIESDARVIYTYTPLKGMTELTIDVIARQAANDPNVHVTNITWDDVPHLSEAAKALILSSTPKYLRDARSKGIPVAGEGRIYQIEEERIVCDTFPIPKHWKWVAGFDVGFYNTAAVFFAIDPDRDAWYAVSEYCDGGRDETSGEVIDHTIHATRLKMRSKVLAGFQIPFVGDCAELEKSSGKSYQKLYAELDLPIKIPDKAVFAGLEAVQTKLANGSLKIFKTCTGLLNEIRQYSQDSGKPIKVNDHRVDALRYAVVSGGKIAESKPSGESYFKELSFG
jgi:phage terminase large subunit-like protein